MSGKRPPSAGGKKDPNAPPAAAPPRPAPRKPRAVAVADLVTLGIVPITDDHLAAPTLGEDHMYFVLNTLRRAVRSVNHHSDTAARQPSTSSTNSSSGETAPSPAPPVLMVVAGGTAHPVPVAPSNAATAAASNGCTAERRQRFESAVDIAMGRGAVIPVLCEKERAVAIAASKAEAALAQHPLGDRCLLRLVSCYRAVHGQALRVHEEISRNCRINIADLALVEQTLFEQWLKESDLAPFLCPDHPKLAAAGSGASLVQRLQQQQQKVLPQALSSAVLAAPSSGSAAAPSPQVRPTVTTSLPPVAILVLFLWTCDAQDLFDLFKGDQQSGGGTSPTNAPRSPVAVNHQANAAQSSSFSSAFAKKGTSSASSLSSTTKSGGAVLPTAAMLANKIREQVAQAMLRKAEGGGAAGAGGSLPSAHPDSSPDEEEDFSRGARTFAELRLALQNPKCEYYQNKWAGTLAVLLASIEAIVAVQRHVSSILYSTSSSSLSVQAAAGGGPLVGSPSGAKQLSRPASTASQRSATSSHKSSNHNGKEDATATQSFVLRCRLQCKSAEAALKELEMLATSSPQGFPVPLPSLLSWSSSPLVVPPTPHTVLRRVEHYVSPNLEVDEENWVYRTAEETIHLMCEGWHVTPRPPPPPPDAAAAAAAQAPSKGGATKDKPPTPSGKKPPAAAAAGGAKQQSSGMLPLHEVPVPVDEEPQYLSNLPTYLTLELEFETPEHCVRLRDVCALHRSDYECLLSPLLQFRVHQVIPHELKLQLRPIVPVRDGDTVVAPIMEQFTDRVLSDGRRASMTASNVCQRLMNLFVKPHHCHRHPAQQYVYFCSDCRKLLCVACTKEVHSVHQYIPIAAFCHGETQRLQRAIAVLSKRAALLKQLLPEVAVKHANMTSLVDKAIDDLKSRVQLKRETLTKDAEQRSELQRQQLRAELARTVVAKQESTAVYQTMGLVRYGITPSNGVAPEVKPLMNFQVLDRLTPRLPTTQICTLIAVMTWSNPSKYLIHLIYPPEALLLATSKKEHLDQIPAAAGKVQSE